VFTLAMQELLNLEYSHQKKIPPEKKEIRVPFLYHVGNESLQCAKVNSNL
jgi:hypothetical protein